MSIDVFNMQAEPGSTIKLGRVLALKSDGKFSVGQPYLGDVTVEARVLEELKGPKIIVRRISFPCRPLSDLLPSLSLHAGKLL